MKSAWRNVYRTTGRQILWITWRPSSIAPLRPVYRTTEKSSIAPPPVRLSRHQNRRKPNTGADLRHRNTRAFLNGFLLNALTPDRLRPKPANGPAPPAARTHPPAISGSRKREQRPHNGGLTAGEPPARGFPRYAAPLPPDKRFATLTGLSKGAHLRARWRTTALPLGNLASSPPPQGFQPKQHRQ